MVDAVCCYWMLTARYWMLDTGCRILDARYCEILDARYWFREEASLCGDPSVAVVRGPAKLKMPAARFWAP